MANFDAKCFGHREHSRNVSFCESPLGVMMLGRSGHSSSVTTSSSVEVQPRLFVTVTW